MSDFLDALVARNLGIHVGPTLSEPEVQPRTPTLFEPGTAEPSPADGVETGAPSTRTELNGSARPARDKGLLTPAVHMPAARTVRINSDTPRQLIPPPGQHEMEAPSAERPQPQALESTIQAIRLTPSTPVSVQPPPTPEPGTNPVPSVPSHLEAQQEPSRSTSEFRDLKPVVPPAPTKEVKAPTRPPDPPLERIIRQMVLSPGPDTQTMSLHEAQVQPAEAKQAERTQRPTLSDAAQPLHPIVTRIMAERDPVPPRAALTEPLMPRTEDTPNRTTPESSLAPLTPPLQVPPIQPSETIINVRIGRIEVKGMQDDVRAKPAKATPRPQPVIMSLDEYLENRSREG